MVCIYCGKSTSVVNSRPQKRLNQIWRRRYCLRCNTTVTTTEVTDYSQALAVEPSNQRKHPEPFKRDKLFLSLYSSLGHRKTVLEDATALTATVIGKLIPHYDDPFIERDEIIKATTDVLKRFDKVAVTHYKAYHALKD